MNPIGGMANDRLGGQPHHLLHRGLLAESAFGGKADIVSDPTFTSTPPLHCARPTLRNFGPHPLIPSSADSCSSLAYAKHFRAVTCLPANLTGEQARLSIEKYMRDHPEKLNLHAVTIAGLALTLAFPCSN